MPCRPRADGRTPDAGKPRGGARHALERDHEYLLRGDVFTKDAIHEWLDFKRNKELNPIRMRPTPYEFYLYFDIDRHQGDAGGDHAGARRARDVAAGAVRSGDHALDARAVAGVARHGGVAVLLQLGAAVAQRDEAVGLRGAEGGAARERRGAAAVTQEAAVGEGPASLRPASRAVSEPSGLKLEGG